MWLGSDDQGWGPLGHPESCPHTVDVSKAGLKAHYAWEERPRGHVPSKSNPDERFLS